MKTTEMNGFFTVNDVAAIAGKSTRWITKLIKGGQINAVPIKNKEHVIAYVIPAPEVWRYLKSEEQKLY